MKNLYLKLAVAMAIGSPAYAQLSEGGIPLSNQMTAAVEMTVPVSKYPLPDWNKELESEQANQKSAFSQAYKVALFTAADFSFPASGVFYKTEDGRQIWKAQIKVDDAKAIGLYYDKFQLPQGVQLYVSNQNNTQILGAYTSANNQPSGKFANEAVQGGAINLELDIQPGVDVAAIQLHIDRAAVYFRGVEYLNYYANASGALHEIDAIDSALSGGSSVCMINSICPQGVNYTVQKNATLQELFVVDGGVGACSGTMLNTTGNTVANCKRYFLSATHCDGANSTSSDHFDQAIIRFNFAQATCSGTGIPVSNTMLGANFVARANYDAPEPTDILGDFMLLELRAAIPTSWGINLAGWNKAASIPTTVSGSKKFIGFHHPDADMKKLSTSTEIVSEGLAAPNTHWATMTEEGLVSTGSSGSALFDGDGYVIGIASVAGPVGVSAACKRNAADESVDGTSDFVAYGKFSYSWDYSVDGTANMRKLKPWLDPANTGAITVAPVKSNCTALDGSTSITSVATLDNNINVYPNPVVGRKANIQINLPELADLKIEVVDVTGKRLQQSELKSVRSGNYSIDLSGYAAGMYLIKFSSDGIHTSKKVMVP